MGADHGELPPAPEEPRFAYPDACDGCSRRAECSPPAAWGDELAPFGPTDPKDQWKRLAPALAAVTGAERARELDAIVDRMIDPRIGATITLEPSLALGPSGPRRALRLAVFHGRLPDERRAAHAATRAALEAFGAAHEDAGAHPPRALLEVLGRYAPLPLPLGLEQADGGLRLKAYARVHAKAPAARASLLAELQELARTEGCEIADEAIPAERLGMIGLATSAGRLVEVKAYVEARPTEGALFGLPAMPADHLLVRLSRDRAHAVVDVARARVRPPKWDFRLRDALLPGHLAARIFGAWVGAESSAALAAFAERAGVRLDVVAASIRADEAVLYFDVG
jgi:hypothetical protein